ncbi:MAG: hypothetical protein KFKLKKLM_02694 [Flavobacteriales bacterium]|nr:hypothetical protein [Flavobacteriales bacterium]
MKRIIICSDGTWNKPEEDLTKDFPTNVLKFSRAIKPVDDKGVAQTVFYDWGIGSYHDKIGGGGFGAGLDKNIMDGYRYIVHNYDVGDEIFLFGFSRGAYTVRCLAGLINNCSILKKEHENKITEAYTLYKNPEVKPDDETSQAFRAKYSHAQKTPVHFVGVWDTVGALGLPKSVFGFIKDKHLFYDNKIGSIIKTARHALSIDEKRKDFEPTIWQQDWEKKVDLKQVWFAGVHSDVGGSYPPDKNGHVLSDIPMMWMKKEAEKQNLQFQPHIENVVLNPTAKQNKEESLLYKMLGLSARKIVPGTYIHQSVKTRFETTNYKPLALTRYLEENGGQWNHLTE